MGMEERGGQEESAYECRNPFDLNFLCDPL